jgi:3-phenylpropionate/trans-cinnamate dioxygenase ferredoxin subunit
VRYVVGTTDEIPPGTRKLLEVGGREIGIFNIDGEFFAIRNRCPHQGASLCRGQLYGTLESAGPGDYTHGDSQLILRCPWHGWEFDVRSGRSWWDPDRTRVRRYEIHVDVPLAAETYPVTATPSRQLVVEI